MEYCFVIYTNQKISFVKFLEKEITKNWEPSFPAENALVLENKGYDTTGVDGLFKIPQAVSREEAYKALRSLGYKYGTYLSKCLKQEFPEYDVMIPKQI